MFLEKNWQTNLSLAGKKNASFKRNLFIYIQIPQTTKKRSLKHAFWEWENIFLGKRKEWLILEEIFQVNFWTVTT